MPQQLLRDPGITPTDKIIAQGLGKTNETYVAFIEQLKTHGITLMKWRYYNDGKAWLTKGEYKWTTSRGTNKIKPIFWLSIWEGFFKLSFFFAVSRRDELLNMSLSEETKHAIKNQKTMGKTERFLAVVLDIKDAKQLDDTWILVEARKERVK